MYNGIVGSQKLPCQLYKSLREVAKKGVEIILIERVEKAGEEEDDDRPRTGSVIK